MAERIAQVDVEPLAKELAVGVLTLKDILAQLVRPGRDPREDLPAPVFKRGIIKLEDLAPGMELTGTVLNVVDFGCFVDIGMHDSGLVHVSRLADKFIRDPHDVVAVGDIVKVWVMAIDKERRRVSLTMVRPGSERARPPRRTGGGTSRNRWSRPQGEPGGEGAPRKASVAGGSVRRARRVSNARRVRRVSRAAKTGRRVRKASVARRGRKTPRRAAAGPNASTIVLQPGPARRRSR